jgi:hypothetical protein
MKGYNVLCLLLLGSLLYSCQPEAPEGCSEDFVAKYNQMGDLFQSSYAPGAGKTEQDKLSESMDEFLVSYKDVECDMSGETLKPTQDIVALQKSIEDADVKMSVVKFSSKVIYGVDNRRDVSDVSSDKFKSWSKSTLAQISPDKIGSDGSIISGTLGDAYSLCSTEAFTEQKNPARCSGFLVAPNIVVTAGHCMTSESDCSNYRWVTDFVKESDKISESQVFKCKRIISQALEQSTQLDYAVVELDRDVTDRKFFRVEATKKVSSVADLVVIGHPSGLPTKVADGGKVRSNSSDYFFSASLDTYGGNSGSAVINEATGVVEGILVRGETDYIWGRDTDGASCRVSNVCSESECRGEDVTRMSKVEGIPAIKGSVELREILYTSQTAPIEKEGWIATFASYELAGHGLGAYQFLDRCGVHHYDQEAKGSWFSYFSGKCSSISSIDQVMEDFSESIYL